MGKFSRTVRSPEGDILSGDVDLMGVVMNKLERIKIELFDRDYVKAIRAYQERLPVLCRGDLVKENNCFVLKNICSLWMSSFLCLSSLN
ncbi:MAG: hypothetical protein WBA93_07435 [Microcoleaceae cyanobacterium]